MERAASESKEPSSREQPPSSDSDAPGNREPTATPTEKNNPSQPMHEKPQKDSLLLNQGESKSEKSSNSTPTLGNREEKRASTSKP
jgi:hypothetical protein